MAALTEEQTLIKDQAKSWVTAEAPVQQFRQVRDQDLALNYAPETWSAMIDMGWTGILVPEEFGGSGLGYQTFGLILEETGRQLTASPLFASAYAGASALMMAGSESQKHAILPKIVDGSIIATIAIDETPRHNPLGVSMQANASSDGFVLNGTKTFVQEGMAATHVIVAARTAGKAGDSEGITLFLVDVTLSGVTRHRLQTVDSRGYANFDFENVSVTADAILGELDNASTVLHELLDCCRVGVAAEMMGTASQAFDMTLEYLKTREQFGRVIGSFQALGHRAAGLFTAMELTRSCVEAGLAAVDAGAKDIPSLSSLAKCRAGDFLHEMSNQLIQIHGGIGMTDEFDAGFYLKRARVLEAMFGNQAFHRDRYARLLGF